MRIQPSTPPTPRPAQAPLPPPPDEPKDDFLPANPIARGALVGAGLGALASLGPALFVQGSPLAGEIVTGVAATGAGYVGAKAGAEYGFCSVMADLPKDTLGELFCGIFMLPIALAYGAVAAIGGAVGAGALGVAAGYAGMRGGALGVLGATAAGAALGAGYEVLQQRNHSPHDPQR